MKKYLLSLLCIFGIGFTTKGQTFQEYLEQFPLLSTFTVWQDSEIASLPTSNKPTLDVKYHSLINGKGEWASATPVYTRIGTPILYPLGRVESGNTVIVFMAVPSGSYRADYDTQISIDAYSYNKKSGNLLRSGYNFYLLSVGGDPVTNTFMYTGKIETDAKSWLKIYQTGTGSAVKKQHAYKISGKGLSFDKEF